MSVGSRLFTAVGVLLAVAAVAGQLADPLAAGSAAARTVVAVVGMVAAACGVVAAVDGARAPDAVHADPADLEAVVFAPVSHAAAAVVGGGAASAAGVAAAQPWLTWVGVLAVVVATALQVGGARAASRTRG